MHKSNTHSTLRESMMNFGFNKGSTYGILKQIKTSKKEFKHKKP